MSVRVGNHLFRVAVIVGATLACGLTASSWAMVGGVRDCAANALHSPGDGCYFPTVGTYDFIVPRPGGPVGVSICTARLVYNGPDKAVILTAAHCIFFFGVSGVNFDSQIVDDSVTPYRPVVILPQRIIRPDAIILHPNQRSTFLPGRDPVGNSQLYTTSDLALIIIDDPGQLSVLNTLWDLPDHGQLVNLLPEDFLDTLSPREFRNLQILDVGYGMDWIDHADPSGAINIGHVGNAGFRTVVTLEPVGISAERILTSQNHQSDGQGICYGDSGSSAFILSDPSDDPTLVAMPTWVNDGGTKCHATVQWLRLDRPNARDFINCAFVPGDKSAIRACVDAAFPSN